MNEEEYSRRLEALSATLLEIYFRIGKLLTLLPIPISIPPVDEEEGPSQSIEALVRARIIVLDLPLDTTLLALLNMLITEWLCALDLCALSAIDQATYRLDSIWLMLQRLDTMTEMVKEQLDIDP